MKKQILLIVAVLMLSWSANAQMVLEFNTNLSDGTTITLPLYGTVDVTVNWGDGASDTYTAAGNHDHEYTAEGTYTVSITGSLTQFGATYTNSANMDKLVRVTSFGDIGLTSLKGAFWKATNLVDLPSELPSTITDLSYMLFGASKFDGNIGSWNVSNVTNMGFMFCNATKFNQDISTWDVSNVTNMTTMFSSAAAFNQNIGGWDVSKVTGMTGMFESATAFNQDIGTWDVSSVTSMERMFSKANAFNQNIGGWDVSKVTNIKRMFMYAHFFNQDISSWNVSAVTNMEGVFYNATAFNQDIGGWDVSNVTNMYIMFYGATSFNQDLNTWDVSEVTTMDKMFRNATSFDQNIGGWNITSVTDMTEMFLGATLSTANYNNILIGWAAQTVQNGVTFHGGNSKYSPGAAADARAVLTGTYNWTITDGGETTNTAINTTSETNISIYPNPTHNVLNFNFAGEQVQTIKMVDITGKTVLEKTNVRPSETIDISNLDNGLYLVVVQTDKENISYKIIKE